MNSNKSIKTKIIAHLDGELRSDELNELYEWISKSDENSRYYTEVKDLWEASIFNASEIAETEKEWGRFVSEVNNRKLRLRYKNLDWSFISKAAAILIAGIFIGNLVSKYSIKKEPTFCTAIAPAGSISKMILPDSTHIYLNAGSKVRYSVDLDGKQREVFLNGEAWFKVRHLNNKPFIVHTDCYDVNVLGTEFNVKAYDSDSRVETTLEKGSVLITSSDDFKISEDIVLKPGEQLIFERELKVLKIKNVNTKLFTSWKDNKLEFIKMNLKELIVLLERKYGVEIVVEDSEILNYHYTGTIKNETILEILSIIEHTMPIQYEIDDQKNNNL